MVEDKEVRVKTVTTYRVETSRVPKVVAARRAWRKFGEATGEERGNSNSKNTTIS